MNSVFRPRLAETLLASLFIGLFCSLGVWQLNRADEKRGILQQIESRADAPAVQLSEALSGKDELLPYQQVVVTGRYLDEGIVYIDNVLHDGHSGVDVIMPLQLEGSDRVVPVNRGWIAHGRDRKLLPAVAVPKGLVSITGQLRQPSKLPLMDASAGGFSREQPNLWLYMDLAQYETESGYQLVPMLVLQTSEDDSGLLRQWLVFEAKTAMHTAYAIQWFGLAVVTLAIFLKVSFKRRDRSRTDGPE